MASFHLDSEPTGSSRQHPECAANKPKTWAVAVALGAAVGMIGFFVCEPFGHPMTGDGVISFDLDCVQDHMRVKDAGLDMLADCEVTSRGKVMAKAFATQAGASHSRLGRSVNAARAAPQMQQPPSGAYNPNPDYEELSGGKDPSLDDIYKDYLSQAEEESDRLDGEDWEWPITLADPDTKMSVDPEWSIDFDASGATAQAMEVMMIGNMVNQYLPYQVGFTAGSNPDFYVDGPGDTGPQKRRSGTMNRRSGDPLSFTIRYKPVQAPKADDESYFVIETEEWKKAWRLKPKYR